MKYVIRMETGQLYGKDGLPTDKTILEEYLKSIGYTPCKGFMGTIVPDKWEKQHREYRETAHIVPIDIKDLSSMK